MFLEAESNLTSTASAIPETDEREDQKLMSADELTQWLMCCIEDGGIMNAEDAAPFASGMSAGGGALRRAFYGFCKQRGTARTPGPREVSERLTEIFGASKANEINFCFDFSQG